MVFFKWLKNNFRPQIYRLKDNFTNYFVLLKIELLTVKEKKTWVNDIIKERKRLNDNYSKVNVRVTAIFVAPCIIPVKQQFITSQVKLVDKPLPSPKFLTLMEIDLMDFQNCQCVYSQQLKWAMNIICQVQVIMGMFKFWY